MRLWSIVIHKLLEAPRIHDGNPSLLATFQMLSGQLILRLPVSTTPMNSAPLISIFELHNWVLPLSDDRLFSKPVLDIIESVAMSQREEIDPPTRDRIASIQKSHFSYIRLSLVIQRGTRQALRGGGLLRPTSWSRRKLKPEYLCFKVYLCFSMIKPCLLYQYTTDSDARGKF